jgi:putative PIN family toxin of toxin-antitoxin system
VRLVAVFDTNVLFSSVAWKGRPFECVELARSGTIEGATSREIIDELMAKLQSKLAFDPRQALDAAADLLGFLRVVPISGSVKGVVADPDDDKVLETAVVAGATHVVTGDRRHLIPIGTFQGVAIVSPADFLTVAATHESAE